MIRIIICYIFFISFLLGNNLSLKDCILLGIKNKSIVKTAILQNMSAEQSLNIAFSETMPTINFSSGFNKTYFPERETVLFNYENLNINKSNENYSQNLSTGISLVQKIYNGGQTKNRIIQARSLSEQSHFNYLLVKINVIQNIIHKYFEYLKSIELKEVALQNISLSEKQLELVKNQFSLGAINKTDLLKGEVTNGLAKSDLMRAIKNIKSARRNFFFAMGIPDNGESFSKFNLDILSYPLPDKETLTISIEKNNPNILVKKSIIKHAKYNFMISKGMRFPIINTTFNYSVMGENSIDWFNNLKNNWTFGINLSISIPIFTGYGLSSQIQQKRIQWNSETEDFINLKESLNLQAFNILEILKYYLDILPIQFQVVESAKKDFSLIQERYSLGAVSILELLNTQVSLNQANTSWVNMKYDFWISAASLKALTGELNENFGIE